MTVNDVKRDQVLFHSTWHGKYAPAPMVTTEVEIDVSGIVARTTVRKYFVNPAHDWLVLITLYPFDALIPGGPLRYLMHAAAYVIDASPFVGRRVPRRCVFHPT